MDGNGDGRVCVVGAGLGGLAAACTLAARGYGVDLYERNAWLGGKAAVLEADGFRFDMGPTILTIPAVLRRIFGEAGRNLEDELDLIPLDPQWRCMFEDGSRLDLVADTDEMAATLGEFAPDAGLADGYRKFMKLSHRLSDVSDDYFFWKPVGSLRDTFSVTGTFSLSVLSDILSMRMGHTVSGTVHKYLRDPRPAQMAEHFTQYVGSSPLQSPAILCGIAHMQTDQGIWYPRGGTRAVPVALEKLARELQVEVHPGTSVDRITFEDGAVTGIETGNGEARRYAAVVSNMDSVRTHRELLQGDPSRAFAKRRSYEPACSGVVLYLGLKERYDHLLHHNFVFSRDPVEEFTAIYREGRPAPDPTCYVCAPSCTEPEIATEGGEALYVLVHTPYLQPDHDWQKMLPEYREPILRKLETTGGMPDIRDRIVFESALTPESIGQRYSVLDGAIYGLASHGRFTGAFKPGNRSPDLRGLYLAGGSAHPGPGMPMALMSGWIAADTLDEDGVAAK
jgi:phytoene desaturase